MAVKIVPPKWRVEPNSLATRVKMLAISSHLQSTQEPELEALAHQMAMCVKALLYVARVQEGVDRWSDARQIIDECVGQEWKKKKS